MNNIKVSLLEDKNYLDLLKNILYLFDLKKYEDIKSKIEHYNENKFTKNKLLLKDIDEITTNINFIKHYYLSIFYDFAEFLIDLKQKEFQKSWCTLQHIQDTITICYNLIQNKTDFNLDTLSDYLYKIEQLYPYVVFSSTECIVEKTCSICKNNLLDKKCTHLSGDIYNGELAGVNINIIEFLGISLVYKPAHKSCTLLPENKYDYKNFPLMSSYGMIYSFFLYSEPFFDFEILIKPKIITHSEINTYNRELLCPCRSEKPFKDCCIKKRFIFVKEKYISSINKKLIDF